MSQSLPQVSILVPIYNVEQYLPTCLDSLVHQTLKDLEIICINDGSTDGSLDIIKSYQTKYSKLIKLIDKPNTGYGDSMNQGLKEAKGLYIGIVEPDDYIDTDAFEQLYRLAENSHVDVARANYYRETSSSQRKVTEITSEISGRILTSPWSKPQAKTSDHTDYLQVFRLSPAIWAAIYRREFLEQNHIEFLPTPGASYQDTGFNFKVWATAHQVILTDAAYLHYRIDNASSSINNPGKVNCVVTEYDSIEEYLRERHLLDQVAPHMVATQFRNYHWNFQRLSSKHAKQFYQVMRQSLLRAKSQHWLEKSNFSRLHWLSVQGIIYCPHLTYALLRLRAKLT